MFSPPFELEPESIVSFGCRVHQPFRRGVEFGHRRHSLLLISMGSDPKRPVVTIMTRHGPRQKNPAAHDDDDIDG